MRAQHFRSAARSQVFYFVQFEGVGVGMPDRPLTEPDELVARAFFAFREGGPHADLLKQLASAVTEAHAARAAFKREVDSLSARLAQVEHERDALKATYVTLTQSYALAMAKLESQAQSLEALQAELNRVDGKEDILREQLGILAKEILQAANRLGITEFQHTPLTGPEVLFVLQEIEKLAKGAADGA